MYRRGAFVLPLSVGAALIVGLAGGCWILSVRAEASSVPYCASCISTEIIEPRLLVAGARDLPGFARAKTQFFASASASEWASGAEDTAAQAESEAAYLNREGFREGAATTIVGKHREAVSEALVFDSKASASRRLVESVSRGKRSIEKHGLRRFHVAGVPGSVGLGAFRRGRRGTVGDLWFATGRCWFVVADRVPGAKTRGEGTKALVAAANAIYKRVRAPCDSSA